MISFQQSELLREMCRVAGKDKEYITELLRSLPLDHPAMSHTPVSWLANPRWAKESLQEWSDKSPHWESRVRGRFPTQAEDALISLAWLEEAKNRDPRDDGSPLKAGVDVAGPGKDETAAVIRCGNSIIEDALISLAWLEEAKNRPCSWIARAIR